MKRFTFLRYGAGKLAGRRRLAFCALIALYFFAHPAPAQTLQQRVEDLIFSSPGARRAFWGIQVVALETGEKLVDINSERFFTPASNTKLFATALALARLGPDHRFETVVMAESAPGAAGRLRGDLKLVGGGDPSLSDRVYPYSNKPGKGNPLQAIEALAEQVVAAGVARIEGDVIGNDTAYIWAPYPQGWAVEDTVWYYGAPVSALSVNDNAVLVRLRAGAMNRPVSVTASPPLDYFFIDNRVRVHPAERAVRIERIPGSRQLRLWGTLPPKQSADLLVAIDDPALYAAHALADALRRRGVTISGRILPEHRFANDVPDLKYGQSHPVTGFELARRSSPPLTEILEVINKVSHNLHAEIVLREVGRVRRQIGSREAGLEELYAFLTEAGIERSEYVLEDGSGLSKLNLVTPAVIVRLLQFMYSSEYRESWFSTLAVGGRDGTLSTRFRGPAGRSIRAKTGTLTHVNTLSGYVNSASRGLLAFSILCNNHRAPGAEIRTVADKISILIAE